MLPLVWLKRKRRTGNRVLRQAAQVEGPPSHLHKGRHPQCQVPTGTARRRRPAGCMRVWARGGAAVLAARIQPSCNPNPAPTAGRSSSRQHFQCCRASPSQLAPALLDPPASRRRARRPASHPAAPLARSLGRHRGLAHTARLCRCTCGGQIKQRWKDAALAGRQAAAAAAATSAAASHCSDSETMMCSCGAQEPGEGRREKEDTCQGCICSSGTAGRRARCCNAGRQHARAT